MGLFDEMKNKAEELVDTIKEKVGDDKVEEVSDMGIEKAGDAVDSATGGKFSDQIDAGQAKADDAI